MLLQLPGRAALLALAVLVMGPAAPSALVEASSRPGHDRQAGGGTDTGDAKKDKDTVTVRGCLRGHALEGARADEEIEGLTAAVALRASRDLRRELKAYDRHDVEVTGRLKPLPKSPLSRRLGGATVSVGIADPRRPSVPQPEREMATLDVESVRSLASSCTF